MKPTPNPWKTSGVAEAERWPALDLADTRGHGLAEREPVRMRLEVGAGRAVVGSLA
jgi:hypothetical protein